MSYPVLINHFRTPAALAAALLPFGCVISPQAIYKWKGTGVPVAKAPLIEIASGGSLKCEQICPHVEWARDGAGNVTGYRVAMTKPTKREAA